MCEASCASGEQEMKGVGELVRVYAVRASA